MSLQRHIQKQDLLQRGLLPDGSAQYSVTSKPSPIHCEVPQPPPHRSTTLPRHHSAAGSIVPNPPTRKHPPTLDKRDSGFVSGSGDFSRIPPQSNSGDSVILHSARAPKKQQSLSADGATPHKTALVSMEDEDLCRFTWYWGVTSRADCEAMLKEKGVVGNFVVRMNDRGDYIMSFWRKDGVHHHKIQKTNDMYRFEKSAVRAEGFNLPDLLDTYMKHCTDRTIGPYGGQLYPNYDEVWSPPDIDFDQFGSKLSKIKEKSNRPIFSGGPGMGGRYGGKTLHEMKIEMEAEETGSSNSSLNETTEDTSRRPASTAAPGVPNLAAVLNAGLRPNGVADRSSFKKKKAIPPPPVAVKPRPEKKSVPQPPMTPTKPIRHASVATPSSRQYANIMVQQQQQQEDEYNDEDENEEEYVVPSTLLKEEEESESIYQNYNYSEQQTDQTDRGGASYVNLKIGQQQQDESLYANITYGGGNKPKPIPPPRDVRRPRGGHRK